MKGLILVLLILSVNVFAQKVRIKVGGFVIDKDSIGLVMNIKNCSNKSVIIYRPNADDICYNILKVKFRNVKTGMTHEVFPCKNIIDLEILNLTYENSVYLEPGDSFLRPFRFSLKDISPFIIKGNSYSLALELNLKGVSFHTAFKDIYYENLVSNRINWQYK